MRRSRSFLVILALACLAPGTAGAADSWTDPFPGVRRLHRQTGNQNINVLVVDLCAAGVGVRATAHAERGRTVPSFGQLTGAQAAINGDFFSSGYATDGLAMSGGVAWPGSADHGYVAPLAFGPHRVAMPGHEQVAGPEPWMTEIVSGHPTILQNGQLRDNNGDPLCSNRHPRTAVGLSADQRTLYLAVVDGRASTRIGMTCDELSALLRDLGAAHAMNLDGGGSSTMWMQGPGVVNVPSDGSPRVVGNHLAIHASGTGAAPFCPNRPPRGYLDGAACDAIDGWAQDEDAGGAPIDVHVYFGGPAGAEGAFGVATTAATHREDLCTAIGSCAHGFSVRPPAAFLDGNAHEVWAYGIDSAGGAPAVLAGSPQTIECQPPEPPVSPATGRLRHISNPEVFAAWRFAYQDVAVLDDEVLEAYTEADPIPATPELVRAEDQDAVYVLDGNLARHVRSAAAMEAWRFEFSAVRQVTTDELSSYRLGPPWPDEPFLARGAGPAVYWFDAIEPDEDEPGDDPATPGTDPAAGGGCDASPSTPAQPGVPVLLALLALWACRRSVPRGRAPTAPGARRRCCRSRPARSG